MLFILLGFIITYTLFGVDIKSIGNYVCGTSLDVVYYKNKDVEEYIKNTYYKSYDITSIRIEENDNFLIDECKNYSQRELNSYYNSYKNYRNDKDKVDGTCAVVASVSTVMFYDNYDEIYKIDDNNESGFFCELLDAELKKKYTTKRNGTEKGMTNNLLSLAYDLALSKRYGNTEWYHIKKKLNKSLNKNVLKCFL